MILNLVEEEKQKVPNEDSSRIFIGGASQGCLLTNAAFLRYNKTAPLGGIACIIGLQPLKEADLNLTSDQKDVIRKTSFFAYNGVDDPINSL